MSSLSRDKEHVFSGTGLGCSAVLATSKRWALVAWDYRRAWNGLHLDMGSGHDLGFICLMNINEYGYTVVDPGFPRQGRRPLSLGEKPII